jgi:hypothetical protein
MNFVGVISLLVGIVLIFTTRYRARKEQEQPHPASPPGTTYDDAE